MKRLFVLFFIFPICLKAQILPVKDDKIVYETKVDADSLEASLLFQKLMQVCGGLSFAHITIQGLDSVAGKFDGTGLMTIAETRKQKNVLSYHITMHAKDGGYHCLIDSLKITEYDGKHLLQELVPEDLLKETNNSDKAAIDNERMLSDMDLHVQMLLDFIRNRTLDRNKGYAVAGINR
jgi:hypothetical protein